MLAALLALSLFGVPHHHGPRKPSLRPTTHVYGIGVWRLRVHVDPFAGATTCALATRDGALVVDHGRVVRAFGPGVDSTHAVYRIDGGPPQVQSVRDLPATANLTNPSDGLLVMPVEKLAAASVVEVRATDRAFVRRIRVARLDEALGDAARLGCAPF